MPISTAIPRVRPSRVRFQSARSEMSGEPGCLVAVPLRSERDPELEDVLVDLGERLRAIEHDRTRDQDDHLAVVEALAGTYALAFVNEIRRLDRLLLGLRRARKRKRGR